MNYLIRNRAGRQGDFSILERIENEIMIRANPIAVPRVVQTHGRAARRPNKSGAQMGAACRRIDRGDKIPARAPPGPVHKG
jgi:hypothetical protein